MDRLLWCTRISKTSLPSSLDNISIVHFFLLPETTLRALDRKPSDSMSSLAGFESHEGPLASGTGALTDSSGCL